MKRDKTKSEVFLGIIVSLLILGVSIFLIYVGSSPRQCIEEGGQKICPEDNQFNF